MNDRSPPPCKPRADSLWRPRSPSVSIVIPIKDEEDSIPILVERITDVVGRAGLDLAEIVIVDDGSHDATWPAIEKLATCGLHKVRALRLRRNFGGTTTGFRSRPQPDRR